MTKKNFELRLKALQSNYEGLINRPNTKEELGNGIYDRYDHPAITAEHTPLFWRYDLNYDTNPNLMQRFGINATFNSGAILLDGKFLMVVRVEGWDRKSFFFRFCKI